MEANPPVSARRKFFDRILLGSAFCLFVAALVWVFYPSGNRTWHLLITGANKGRISPYLGRFHPYKDRKIGGAAHAATLLDNTIASFAGAPYSLVSLGNEFTGSSEAYFTRGQAIAEIFNTFHLDAMLVGNLDFSFGVPRLRELARVSSFPLLSSNVTQEGSGSSPDFLSGELTIHPGSGLNIALVGLTPPSTPNLTAPVNVQGLRFEQPGNILPQKISRLRQGGADLVVLLTLIDKSRLTADEWSQIRVAAPDVVLMLDFDVEPPAPSFRDGILLKTINGYNQGKEFDELTLEISPQRRIVQFSSRRLPVLTEELPPNPKTRGIVEEVQQKIKTVRDQVVTSFPTDLQRQYEMECPIGNIITDAMRAAAPCDIALLNSGAIQSSVQSGTFTLGDLYSVLPFDNDLVTMDLQGREILEALTLSASLKHGLLQISGGQYVYGNRSADDFELKEVLIASEPLIATRTYRVTANSFLADGGDEFRVFCNGKNVLIGRLQREVVKDYFLAHSASGTLTLPPGTDPRRIRRE